MRARKQRTTDYCQFAQTAVDPCDLSQYDCLRLAANPPQKERRSGSIPTARRPDLAQMICARVLARSAYSQSARDRQIWRGWSASLNGTSRDGAQSAEPQARGGSPRGLEFALAD
jgi:hypothetical protein